MSKIKASFSNLPDGWARFHDVRMAGGTVLVNVFNISAIESGDHPPTSSVLHLKGGGAVGVAASAEETMEVIKKVEAKIFQRNRMPRRRLP